MITVIVPIYRAEKYLQACVDSILAQTLQDFELILVDDGSPDHCPQLCDEIAARASRVRVIHKENGGVSSARNAGMEAARGEYLTFVDADDWVEPKYLEVLSSAMKQADLAICGVEGAEKEHLSESCVTVQKFRTTPSEYGANTYTNYSVNKMYVTDLLRKHRLAFPIKMRRGEDAFFVAGYLCCCSKIAVRSEILYHYRQIDGSAMHRFYTGVCDDEIPLMQRQYDLFHPEGPDSLTPEEEIAFQKWQFGKVLGILRYINEYAPDAAAKRSYARQLLQEPHARQSILQPPPGTGRKAKLAALFMKANAYGPLMKLMEHM